MSHPLSAAFYADGACERTVEIVENVPLALDTWRVRLRCPDIARRIVPGQFIMLRLTGCDDPLLGRPLALYDVYDGPDGRPLGIDVVYLILGKLTARLAECGTGRLVDIWGPLGNGFSPRHADHLIMVAGGIGQTPFLSLAKEYRGQRQYGDPPRVVPASPRLTLCYGTRRADYLAGLDDFLATGADLHLSTDDGSLGHHGFVTDLLERVLSKPETGSRRVVCCGPEPMMEKVARITAAADVPCQVSLETPMACGVGICFSCVARVKQTDGSWDYRRTCVDGPVFEAEQIEW